MAKEAYYFSHDSNARSDEKILQLRAEFGWEGYGLYWAIIETLRESSDYSFSSNAKAGLALSLNTTKEKLNDILELCFEESLLVEKDGRFFSESLMIRMEQIDEKRRKRAEAGRKGGVAKAKAKQRSSNAKAKPSKEKKRKESKVKESKEVYKAFDHLSISTEENDKLVKLGYSQNEIDNIYDKIQNFKKNTNYNSLYLTALNWLKREFPNRKTIDEKETLYNYHAEGFGMQYRKTERELRRDKIACQGKITQLTEIKQ